MELKRQRLERRGGVSKTKEATPKVEPVWIRRRGRSGANVPRRDPRHRLRRHIRANLPRLFDVGHLQVPLQVGAAAERAHDRGSGEKVEEGTQQGGGGE